MEPNDQESDKQIPDQETSTNAKSKKFKVNFDPKVNKGKGSWVWDYFLTEKSEDVCKIMVIVKGKEKECNRKYKHDGGTGNMAYHLRIHHKIFGKNESDDELIPQSQPQQLRINDMFSKYTPHKAEKQNKLRRATSEWLVIDSLPLNTVQKKGYRKMISQFDPAFTFPSHKSIKMDIGRAYEIGVCLLKELLAKTCDTASLTADLWTARSQDGYIGITLHWLTSNFEVRDAIICVEKFDYPHTAKRIKDHIDNKINEFNLLGK